jgi:hypothetical protein
MTFEQKEKIPSRGSYPRVSDDAISIYIDSDTNIKIWYYKHINKSLIGSLAC